MFVSDLLTCYVAWATRVLYLNWDWQVSHDFIALARDVLAHLNHQVGSKVSGNGFCLLLIHTAAPLSAVYVHQHEGHLYALTNPSIELRALQSAGDKTQSTNNYWVNNC